ncbi:MAG TPA: NAD(P)H-dependent oxidoreductase [Bacteroidia bacterium]|nr:NAD(P)H-dependent oxidoreductase [Bacteroidia bacterium]
MITLISGTNRPGSNTLKVATAYSAVLDILKVAHHLISLENLPVDFARSYMPQSQPAEFKELVKTKIRDVQKFIVVIPEYNGTFPGIFKLFIDSLNPEDLRGKKIAVVGVSTGRGGNARGIDHITAAFLYLGMHVYPGHLPISRLRELLGKEEELADPVILRAMHMQAEGFSRF